MMFYQQPNNFHRETFFIKCYGECSTGYFYSGPTRTSKNKMNKNIITLRNNLKKIIQNYVRQKKQ